MTPATQSVNSSTKEGNMNSLPTNRAARPSPMAAMPTQTQISSPRGSSGKFAGLGLVIGVIVVLGATTVLAAKNIGQGNPISKFFAGLPIEQVPVLNSLAPTPLELLATGLGREFDLNYVKQIGGREYSAQAAFDFKAEVASNEGQSGPVMMPVTVHLDSASTYAVDGKMEQVKQNLTFGGSFKSGIMQVDLGKDGFNLDMLQVSKKLAYFKISLSPQVMETLRPVLAAQKQAGIESGADSLFDPEAYLDKYLKLNLDEYMKMINELSGGEPGAQVASLETMEAALNKFINSIKPDVYKLAGTSGLDKMSEYMTVTNHTRGAVNGQSAVMMDLDINTQEMSQRLMTFAGGLPKLFKDHRTDLITYCNETGMYASSSVKCEDIYSEEVFNEMMSSLESNPESMVETKEVFGRLIAVVKLQDVKVAVSPVDGTVLSSSMTMAVTEDSLRQFIDYAASKSGATSEQIMSQFKLESMTFKMSSEEKSRGKFTPLVEPTENIVDVVELMRGYMESMKSSSMYSNELKTGSAKKGVQSIQAPFEDDTTAPDMGSTLDY